MNQNQIIGLAIIVAGIAAAVIVYTRRSGDPETVTGVTEGDGERPGTNSGDLSLGEGRKWQ